MRLWGERCLATFPAFVSSNGLPANCSLLSTPACGEARATVGQASRNSPATTIKFRGEEQPSARAGITTRHLVWQAGPNFPPTIHLLRSVSGFAGGPAALVDESACCEPLDRWEGGGLRLCRQENLAPACCSGSNSHFSSRSELVEVYKSGDCSRTRRTVHNKATQPSRPPCAGIGDIRC